MAEFAHYKQTHPRLFSVTHWVNLVCMFLLIFTGICIHFPFFPYFMGIARGLHVACGFIIVVNLLVRIITAFMVQSAPTKGTREVVTDYKTWLPQKDNRHQFIQWIKYYLFLRKTQPLSAKLGVLQKITYLIIPLLILFQFYTGLCLWEPTMDAPVFMGFTRLVGGIMTVRIIHYFMMFAFIIFIMIHVYLVFMEGLGLVKLMLFGKESGGLIYSPERHVVIGEDETDYSKPVYQTHIIEED